MRLKMPREFYIPKDSEKIQAADSTAVAYLAPSAYRTGAPCWHAVAFCAKRNKPDWNYTFRTEAQARQYIADHAAGVKRSEEFRAKVKAERYDVRAADHFKVGDLLHTSWGYEQTNVEFYKIVRVLDKSVEVVAIGGKEVQGTEGFMSCAVTPDPNVVLTSEWETRHNGIKRVQRSGDSVYVRIHDHSGGYPIKVGGQTYCSSYA